MPSATWCMPATISASSRPRPSSIPTWRLRERSPVQVSTRSPMPARPRKVSGSAPIATAEARDLAQPARHDGGARVLAEAQAVADADRDRDHVLQRAAELRPDHVAVRVAAEGRRRDRLLHRDRIALDRAGQRHRGRLAVRDLAREGGTREEHEPRVVDRVEHLLQHLVHAHPGAELDALHRRDQRSPRARSGVRRASSPRARRGSAPRRSPARDRPATSAEVVARAHPLGQQRRPRGSAGCGARG